jgi:transcriptional regulator
MDIAIKIILSTDGEETTMNISVKKGQSIQELNEKHFASHLETQNVKWIYYGRTLPECIPESVSQGSVIHVYVAYD